VTPLRRIAFPLALTWARLTRRGPRFLLVALGVATGAALLAGVLAGSLVAEDRSVERATARVPAADRTVRLVWGGIASGTGGDVRALDRTARRTFERLVGSPTRAMLFRTTQENGRLFDLGAIDGLARYVHVRSGHFPAPCQPQRCEVLQLGGSGPIPVLQGLRLTRVGRATLDSPIPFGDLITRETYASVLSSALRYHTAPTPPLLLAEGVDGLATAGVFAPNYRSYTWTAALKPANVHPWTIDRFARAVTRARSDLQAQSLSFDLTAPLAELRAAKATSRVAGRRLLLIGGEAAAMLLAFAVLAATGLRRDAEAQWRRLTWYGASRWQLALGSIAETAAVVLAGAAVGWAVGCAAGAYVAVRAGAPAADVLTHSVLDGRGYAVAVGLAASATLVVVLSLRAGAARLGALSVTPVDAAAVGAALAVLLALARGAADTDALSEERGTGAVLLVLPALIAFVAAVVWARVLAPGLRLLERHGRSAPVPARLAALSLARSPGRAAVSVAFLVVSLGLAFFAETYRATLSRGQQDQAAFAAPTDFLVREDLTKLVPVSQAASPARFETVAAGGDTMPVLRLSGNVRRLEEAPGLTVLGIPAEDIRRLRWRDDYSPLSQEEIARRLKPAGPVSLQGLRIPASARRFVLPLSARGDELAVRAVVLTAAGRARGIPLGTTTSRRLSAEVPGSARGGLLVSLTFDLTSTGLHGVPNGGANAAAVAQGTMRIGRPRVDGSDLPFDLQAWQGTGGLTLRGDGTFRYVVTGENVAQLRAQQPTDDLPVPMIVSPRLAAATGPGGILPIGVGGGTVIGRVVGTARHVPTVDEDAVLADAPTIATALNAAVPGTGTANEVWLDPPGGRQTQVEAALLRPPFDVLQVTSHAELLGDLRSEPLARGTLVTLTLASIAALVLALVGLLLGVVSDLRDERGELFDLEAQGATPGMLRRHLRLRAGLVTALGLVGGTATGAVLAALIVALVTLTAGGGSAQPPLLLALDWISLLLGLVAYLLLATLVIGLATRRAFRADVAGRFAEVGT
jgi:hypothetical protein